MLSAQLDSLIAQGVAPAEAAELLGMAPAVAKLATDDLNFSDDDLAAALAGVASIARHGEQERNRLQAGMFIIEVKKGYKAPKVDNRTQNITLVQQLINQANDDINEFARELRAGDGRGDPAAIEEQREVAPSAGPVAAGTGDDVPAGAAGEQHVGPAYTVPSPTTVPGPTRCEQREQRGPGRGGTNTQPAAPAAEQPGDRSGAPAPRYEQPRAACIKGPTRV